MLTKCSCRPGAPRSHELSCAVNDAARTVAELGVHQHDAETILKKLDEIEAAQRQRR